MAVTDNMTLAEIKATQAWWDAGLKMKVRYKADGVTNVVSARITENGKTRIVKCISKDLPSAVSQITLLIAMSDLNNSNLSSQSVTT